MHNPYDCLYVSVCVCVWCMCMYVTYVSVSLTVPERLLVWAINCNRRLKIISNGNGIFYFGSNGNAVQVTLSPSPLLSPIIRIGIFTSSSGNFNFVHCIRHWCQLILPVSPVPIPACSCHCN